MMVVFSFDASSESWRALYSTVEEAVDVEEDNDDEEGEGEEEGETLAAPDAT